MSNYVKKIVPDYCVIDAETTGLSAYYGEVIEIGILRVRNGEVTDRYEQLIKPESEIDGFITSLTGITNEMVADKPLNCGSSSLLIIINYPSMDMRRT